LTDSTPSLPLVTIVTPTYNMARFLPETIESVLSQDYPRIQYIVMDAASTDNTVELLKNYGSRLEWVSEKDSGQSDAVNKGFQRAKGEIFTFLNADDVYYPGAVRAAVDEFLRRPDAGVVYGNAWYTSEDGQPISRYPVQDFDYGMLGHLCFICQPASFLRSRVWAEMGGLDTSLHLTLDYDLWLRIAKRHPLVHLDRDLATCRMYLDNKSLARRREQFREICQILSRHRGYVPLNWLYGYAGYLLDGKDDFYEPSLPSLKKYLLTLGMGLWFNPWRPHLFLRECLGNARLGARMLVAGRDTRS
jgi:glycosyltransferase involved in cell wall biosynthesis